MSNLKGWKSGTALLLMLGLTSGTITPMLVPMVTPAPAVAQSTGFSDVSSTYWARDFIQALAVRDIIKGFPDGTFRPEQPVTRAQFAAIIQKAFQKDRVRPGVRFVDVPQRYWAVNAIAQAYETGFLAGYPGNVFNPEQRIPREQVLVSLANGLNYSASAPTATTIEFYNDASAISGYARPSIAAASEKRIVVNYPNVRVLNPTRNATRAEVAAFVYQALVSSGLVLEINSPYVVAIAPTTPPVTTFTIPSGTIVPVRYDKQKILLTPEERVPLTLTVAANIQTAQGRVIVPSGSEVVGELQPTTGGTQFVARELRLSNGQRLAINANSGVISRTEAIKKGVNTGKILTNAVVGAGAAAAISAVTGDRRITALEVLSGAGAGAVIGLFTGRQQVNLLVIEPNTDLNLRLNQDLVIEPN